ncbi:MAG: hypothetical protein KBT27_05490 [Prevotellaceae bacterium]|nr:hypothetical protein [Candidatus Faecinaster equi]
MTYEEAINNIEMHIAEMMVSLQDTDEHLEAEQIAIEALEKQIPKKYEIFNGQASCPNCKTLFGDNETLKKLIHWNMDYCKHCGQALDWSDDE